MYIQEDMINSVEDIVYLLTPTKDKTPAGGTLYIDEDNLICSVIYGYGYYHEKAKVYYSIDVRWTQNTWVICRVIMINVESCKHLR